MAFQKREEAGRPIRSPSLWSGLQGMVWPLSLQGHLWLMRNNGSRLTWACFLPTPLEFEMDCWRASLIGFSSEESWFQGWQNQETKTKENKTRNLALSDGWEKEKGRRGRRGSTRVSRLYLNANHLPWDHAKNASQTNSHENVEVSWKPQAYAKIVKRIFAFTGPSLPILC